MDNQEEKEAVMSLSKRQVGFGFGLGSCLLGMLPPLYGNVQYSQGGQTGPFPEGTVATAICPQGIPLGQSTSVCLNDVWQPSLFPGCSFGLGGGTNTGGQCLAGIPAVLNGNLVYSLGNQLAGPYPQGTVVTLRCLNGQLPNGPSSSSCLGGIWQPPTLGPCESRTGGSGQSCAAGIGTPLNGRIVYSNGALLGPFPSGTAATLLCNAGFVPSGQSGAVCQNGVFLPSILGSCIPAG